MNYKRTATIAIAGGAAAVWLASAYMPNAGVERAAVDRAPVELRGAELASEVARLRERLRPSVRPSEASRNLFRFTRSEVAARESAGRSATDQPTEAAPAVLPPAFRLSGVAEDPGPNGAVRTAVISSPGELFLVKEGDLVTPRYRVVRISAEVVELVEVGTNVPLRLSMR
jgi:hypothetical protein